MKLLFVVSSLGAGGAERVLSLLANRWCVSHDVAVVTIRDAAHDFFVLDRRVRRIALGIERDRWWHFFTYARLVAALRRTIRVEHPDFVVSFVIKTNIFTLLASAGLGARVVVCEHSVIIRDDIDARQDALRLLLYPRAHRIGVLSQSIAAEFQAKYPCIPSRLLAILPNPTIEENVDFSGSPSLARLFGGEAGDFEIVVALGRLHPVKGYASLVEAFAQVARSRSKARLAIFGEGPERENLENAVQKAGLEGVAILPGVTKVSAAVLGQAEVFVMSSRFEGFPMALVEAFSHGVAVAAFDAPGVRDLVQDGENGLLAPAGDAAALAGAITRLLDDNGLRRRLGERARETAMRFSPEAVDRIWFGEVLVR